MSQELDSILNSVKKQLGAEIDYEHFDPELILNINTAFSVLNQIGVGPEEGFMIYSADEVWSDFITDSRLNMVKTYVFLKVKLIFDPPQVSYVADAYQKQIEELEWRLKIATDKFPEEPSGDEDPDHIPEEDEDDDGL